MMPADRVSARLLIVLTMLVCCDAPAAEASATQPGVGPFEQQADVGTVQRAGSAEKGKAPGSYRVTGGGANIWGKEDAFYFLFDKAEGDVTLRADIAFEGAGKDKHRKACLMVRQSLAADAPYVDVAVHGDGLISLQYRATAGGITQEVQAKVKNPATVCLRRQGERFTMFVAEPRHELEPAGTISVSLHGPVFVGLAVSAHDPTVQETAVFQNVVFDRSAVPLPKGQGQ